MADQQLIEIAKALSIEARVLILDEPTASLSAHEVERLFAIVRQTSRARGRGAVRQPPPRRGVRPVRPGDGASRRPARRHRARRASSRPPTSSATWSAGRSRSSRRSRSPVGDVLLEVDGLSRGEAFRDVTFASERARSSAWPAWSARAGPRSRGSCSGSTARTPARSGSGPVVAFDSPSAALGGGIAYVPEDRHQDGLVLDFSIASNVTLPILPRLFPRLLVQAGTERSDRRDATPTSSASG